MKWSDAIDRGTNAARPAAGLEGRLYYETDTFQLFRDSGTTWESVEGQTGASDAADLTYTPADLADWTGSADPGDTNDALDQLASRVVTLEGASVDASAVSYTPTTAADWDSSADPGNTDDALDQLAGRVKDLESVSGPIGEKLFAVEGAVSVNSGTMRIGNHSGVSRTITGVYLHINTAPTGAALIVDVNVSGTTIFTTQSNRPQISAGAYSGNSTTIEAGTWANGGYITVDVDQVGSTVAGSDLTIMVLYQ